MTNIRLRVHHLLLVAAAAALAIACSDNSSTPQGLPNNPATQDQITRGRYLVTSAGCTDCHNRGADNPSDPNWMAGYIASPQINPTGQGKFVTGPVTSYAANLTPDAATGLGSWTPQDIFNALRNGKDKTGNVLCPPMPWPTLRNLSDDDLYSIVAYLRSIRAVTNQVPEDTSPTTPTGQHPDCSFFYQSLQPLPPYPAGNETSTVSR